MARSAAAHLGTESKAHRKAPSRSVNSSRISSALHRTVERARPVSKDELFPTAPPVLLPGPSPDLKKAVIDFQWNAFQLKCTEGELKAEFFDMAVFGGMLAFFTANAAFSFPTALSTFAQNGNLFLILILSIETAVLGLLAASVARHGKKAASLWHDISERVRSGNDALEYISQEIDDDSIRSAIRSSPRTAAGMHRISAAFRRYRFLR